VELLQPSSIFTSFSPLNPAVLSRVYKPRCTPALPLLYKPLSTPNTMSLRTTVTRSLRSAPSSRLAPSSRVFARGFIKPTNAVLSAEDEEKHRAAYEKHRVEVEPKMASVDESFTFEAPTVGSDERGYV